MRLFSIGLCGILFLPAAQPTDLAAQTPPGLLTLALEEAPVPTPRDWERLGVSNYELRILERFYRDQEGIEGYHIAYESIDLSMTGILVQPHIELPDEEELAAAAAAAEAAGEEYEEEEILYPMVVLSHGSPYGLTQAYREIAIELARLGYIVLAPSYRGRGGREGRSQGLPQLARGEVLDLLQLVQIGRQIEYVDTLRMAILGFDDGATTALLGIERSNVFTVAILVSPSPFSGMVEYGYAGLKVLGSRSEEIFGRELSQNELIRELYYLDAFRNAHKITTPMLLMTTATDPGRRDLLYFVSNLHRIGVEHRLLEYPSMFPGFLTAADNGHRPYNWHGVRDAAWGEIFNLIDEHLALPEEEEEDPAVSP